MGEVPKYAPDWATIARREMQWDGWRTDIAGLEKLAERDGVDMRSAVSLYQTPVNTSYRTRRMP